MRLFDWLRRKRMLPGLPKEPEQVREQSEREKREVERRRQEALARVARLGDEYYVVMRKPRGQGN